MGFNKRYINKQTIIQSQDVSKLFSADVLIIEDKWSRNFIHNFKKGYDKEDIIKLLEKNIDKDSKNV
jgi:hypothetical protein